MLQVLFYTPLCLPHPWSSCFARSEIRFDQARTLFQKMGYTGKPNDFSMWACLFADPAFKTVSLENNDPRAKMLEKFSHAHRKKHRLWAAPGQAYSEGVKKVKRE